MLICENCANKYDEKTMRWRCECGSPLSLDVNFSMNEDLIDTSRAGFWRYHRALPLDDVAGAITLGEQTTPLVKRTWNGRGRVNSEVFFKFDMLPTGSYKDRGVAIMLNRLRELGARTVYEDSSGNAGASIAGYCAAAEMPCEVLVPESTSRGKCVQIEAYGAKLVKIPGERDATSRAAENYDKKDAIYASHNWSVYFAHGVKTWLFEVWEALGFMLPDAVVVPSGQGSLVRGAWLAAHDLLRGGAIKKIPKIYAVRSTSPIAEGIASTHVTRKNDFAHEITVETDAILSSLSRLAHMGLYVEPTSAVVGAALDEISERGVVVAHLSSTGLKTK